MRPCDRRRLSTCGRKTRAARQVDGAPAMVTRSSARFVHTVLRSLVSAHGVLTRGARRTSAASRGFRTRYMRSRWLYLYDVCAQKKTKYVSPLRRYQVSHCLMRCFVTLVTFDCSCRGGRFVDPDLFPDTFQSVLIKTLSGIDLL